MTTKTATATSESQAGFSRNGSIPHPRRGAALSMWETFAKAKTELDAEALEKLAEKQGWTLALIKFHHRQWLIFTGKATKTPREAKAAPAKKAAAKKAAAKKAAAKKAAAKKAKAA